MLPKLPVDVLGSAAAELLLRLLRIYSPTLNEDEAVNALMRYASRELGFKCWRDGAGNLIAKHGDGEPKIALVGHIDTVEGDLPVKYDGEIIKGRGAVDAKGPLSSAFIGASHIKELLPSGTVYVIAVVGEEGCSRGAKELIKDGWRFHHLIILEPTNTYKVVVEYRGTASVEVKCSGGGGHAATPWVGRSACSELCSIDSKLRGVCRDASTCRNSPTAAVVEIKCGGEWNVLPREGKAVINVRVPFGFTKESIVEFLNPLIPPTCLTSIVSYTPPVKVHASNPAPRALTRALLTLGLKPSLARKFGTSDMNLLYGKVADDVAAYGPGKSELSHTSMEEVSVEELGIGAYVYASAILQLSSWWGRGIRDNSFRPKKASPSS